MIKPFLKLQQTLNDKTKSIFEHTLGEWTLCHSPWRLRRICAGSRWTGVLDHAMWLPILPSGVREERQIQWWCHTEHLFSCYITFNEAAVVHLAWDRAALCWGWRGSTGLSAFCSVFIMCSELTDVVPLEWYWQNIEDSSGNFMQPSALQTSAAAAAAAVILFLHFMANWYSWKHF